MFQHLGLRARWHFSAYLSLLGAILSPSLCGAVTPDDNTTYDATVRGKHCAEFQGETNCRYQVGKSLDFEVVGIGLRDAGITFYKVDRSGDFYATFGLQHGCVIVKPGRLSLRPGHFDMAFVSPKNGKIYRTWEECQQQL